MSDSLLKMSNCFIQEKYHSTLKIKIKSFKYQLNNRFDESILPLKIKIYLKNLIISKFLLTILAKVISLFFMHF